MVPAPQCVIWCLTNHSSRRLRRGLTQALGRGGRFVGVDANFDCSARRIVRASVASGVAAVVLSFGLAAVRSDEPFEMSSGFVKGAAIYAVLVWLIGAFFAAMLLVPLKPIADRCSRWVSLLVFVTIGAGITGWLGYLTLRVGAHGNPAPIDNMQWSELVLAVSYAGLQGFGCALAAWLSIRRSAPKAAPTMPN